MESGDQSSQSIGRCTCASRSLNPSSRDATDFRSKSRGPSSPRAQLFVSEIQAFIFPSRAPKQIERESVVRSVVVLSTDVSFLHGSCAWLVLTSCLSMERSTSFTHLRFRRVHVVRWFHANPDAATEERVHRFFSCRRVCSLFPRTHPVGFPSILSVGIATAGTLF